MARAQLQEVLGISRRIALRQRIPQLCVPLSTQSSNRRPEAKLPVSGFGSDAISPKAVGDSIVKPIVSGISAATPETVQPRATGRKLVEGYPLSVMPHGMLLRSVLVSTISSHKWLLLPSLSFLSFLTKQETGFLFNVHRNALLHKILRVTFYDQFCAGETEKETKACAQRFKALGFKGVIITYAKETIFNYHTKTVHGRGSQASARASEPGRNPDIEDWKQGCLSSAETIEPGDYLAIKFTGAGPTVTSAFAAGQEPPQQMKDAAYEIADDCRRRGLRLIVDAESQLYQRGIDAMTLDLMRRYNRGEDGRATVFNTYQGYLKRTPANIAAHLGAAREGGFTLGLKLVRGAYILSDNRQEIHDTKQDTDDAYNGIAQGVLKQDFGGFGASTGLSFPSVNLLLCTHNRASVIAAQKTHRKRVSEGLPTVPVVFAQLQGMSDEVSFSLLQNREWYSEGSEVIKCSTWGTMSDCMAYLVRRAVENRDAVLRTTDEHAAVKREFVRRLKSGFMN